MNDLLHSYNGEVSSKFTARRPSLSGQCASPPLSPSKVISGVGSSVSVWRVGRAGALFLTITENVRFMSDAISAVIARVFYLCRPIICNVGSVVRWLVFSLSVNS